MISIETMKYRTEQMVGEEFPLVMWRGTGRIVGSDERVCRCSSAARASSTPGTGSRSRGSGLLANHTLDIDELGGGDDAVGIVSIFAFMQTDGLDVIDPDGLLVLKDRADTPVHQYADMGRPTTWAPWRRRIHGD